MRELNISEVEMVSGGDQQARRWTLQALAGGALWDGLKAAGRYMMRPNDALNNPSSPPVEGHSNTPALNTSINAHAEPTVVAR